MTIDLPLPEEYREVLANLDADAKTRLAELVQKELQKQRLIQTMLRIGAAAERRGMTQEVLDELLKDVS